VKDEKMDEKQLLRSCLEGDAESYRMIVENYRGKAMAMAMGILGNREDAEDACQDAFIKAFQNLDKFDFNRNFKDWMYAIVANRSLDMLRKRRRFFNVFDRIKSESKASSEPESSQPELSRQIREMLMKHLSEKERIALLLWSNESYSGEEIAEILKCSPSTARIHLFKARKKIKPFMERHHVPMQRI